MTLRIYGEMRTFATCLREQPLQASDIWTACRARFHEQLGVTKEEIRALLDSRLVPLPEIATAHGDMIFETPLLPEIMSASSTPMGEQVASSVASDSTVEQEENTEAADDQKATPTTWLETKVEETPD
eukprot:s1475_g4.t1